MTSAQGAAPPFSGEPSAGPPSVGPLSADALPAAAPDTTVPNPRSPLPTASREEQFAWTSYLRVAAISAVVCIHTFAVLASTTLPEPAYVRWVATVLDIGLIWCVPVIVMVSGALLLAPDPKQGAAAFYRRRLGKIAIPLVFWHLFYVVYLDVEQHAHLTVKGALTRIYTLNLASPLYFFWLILGLYAIAPILRGFIASASRRDLAVVTGLALAFNVGQQIVVNLAGAYHLQAPPAANIFTEWLPDVGYFLLGYVLRDLVLTRRQAGAATVVFVALIAEFCWQYRFIAGHSGPRSSALGAHLGQVLPVGYDGPLVVVASVLLFLMARSVLGPGTRWARPDRARSIRTVGDLGLGVFGIHLAVIGVFADHVLPASAQTWPGAPLTRTFLVLAVALAGSFGIVAAMKQIPVLRRLV